MGISIYCDGAYSSSRDQGGWAFVVLENDEKVFSTFYGVKSTTNNRMEIQACLEGLLWATATGHKNIIIYSDSMYLIGTMTKNWKKNKNHDLWILMDKVVKGLIIEFRHVKGHAGDTYNELCDALASEASHIKMNE